MPSEIELEEPDITIVKEAVKKVLEDKDEDEDYRDFNIHNDILTKLFKEHNKNDDLNNVLLKVVLLNNLYYAGVLDIHRTSMAKKIMDIYNEKEYVENPCLVVGDTPESRNHCLGLVNKIAKIKVYEKSKKDKKTKVKVERNFYSFASKFCFFQNNEFFFIYDSYVDESLWQFQKKFKDKYKKYKEELGSEYTEFKRGDLKKDYETFYIAVKQFIDVFGLQNLTNRQIDIYLWSCGKKIKKQKNAQKEKAKKEAEENKSNLE